MLFVHILRAFSDLRNIKIKSHIDIWHWSTVSVRFCRPHSERVASMCVRSRFVAIWMLLNCNYENEWNMRVIIYSIVCVQHTAFGWIELSIYDRIFFFFFGGRTTREKTERKNWNENARQRSAKRGHTPLCTVMKSYYFVQFIYIYFGWCALHKHSATAHWWSRHTTQIIITNDDDK